MLVVHMMATILAPSVRWFLAAANHGRVITQANTADYKNMTTVIKLSLSHTHTLNVETPQQRHCWRLHDEHDSQTQHAPVGLILGVCFCSSGGALKR